MTHPPEAVEAVARALWDENYPPPVHPGDMWQDRIKATALLDQIAPHYREQAAARCDAAAQIYRTMIGNPVYGDAIHDIARVSAETAEVLAAAIRKGE